MTLFIFRFPVNKFFECGKRPFLLLRLQLYKLVSQAGCPYLIPVLQHIGKDLIGGAAQRINDGHELIHARRAHATFQIGEIVGGDPDHFRKLLLCKALLLAELLDALADHLQNAFVVVHEHTSFVAKRIMNNSTSISIRSDGREIHKAAATT